MHNIGSLFTISLIIYFCISVNGAEDPVYTDCGSLCPPTCADPNPEPCGSACAPGFFCRQGLFLNASGKCVELRDCSRSNNSNSSSNSISSSSASSAANSSAKTSSISHASTGPSNNVAEDPVYTDCGSLCPPTCADPNPGPCAALCVPGFFCRQGLFLNAAGKCVQLKDCNQSANSISSSNSTSSSSANSSANSAANSSANSAANSAANSSANSSAKTSSVSHASTGLSNNVAEDPVYTDCGSLCPPTCADPNPEPCGSACVPGFFCRQGLFLNAAGKCVQLKDCDQ